MRHCATSRKVATRLTRIMIMLAFIPPYCVITAALAQIFEAEELVKNFSSFYEGWNFNSSNYLFTTDTK